MKHRLHWNLLPGLALAAGGCNLILGLENADLAPPDGGAGTTTSATGTTASGGSTCTDGVQDGVETDKDCGGGTCALCLVGEACKVGTDCESKVCDGGICATPTCNDQQANGNETDVDCGGGATSGCGGCVDGLHCKVADDCRSDICAAKICVKANVWADHFEGISPTSVRVDSAGRMSLAGNLTGTCDFGGGAITNTGSLFGDVFAARFDTAGQYLWAKQFAGTKAQFARVALDFAGNTVLAGHYSGALQIGTGLTASGTNDIFVAKLDLFGNTLWANHFGASGAALTANGVTTDNLQNIIVAGALLGTVDLGSGPLISDDKHDVFVAQLNSDGAPSWSKRFGGPGDQTAYGVAVDEQRNVWVTGNLSGSTDFGGGKLDAQGVGDVFVAKLDQLGNHVWSKRFGDADEQHGTGIAVDSSGNVIVVGSFQGSIDFGGGPLVGGKDKNVFVVKLDSKGNHLWSRKFDDPAFIAISSLAVDGLDNVIGTGQFGSQVNFGGGTRKSTGSGKSVFAFKLDGAGQHVWSVAFGDTSSADGGGLVVSPSNDKSLIVGGYFGGTIDLGGGPFTGLGTSSAFLAKFLPP